MDVAVEHCTASIIHANFIGHGNNELCRNRHVVDIGTRSKLKDILRYTQRALDEIYFKFMFYKKKPVATYIMIKESKSMLVFHLIPFYFNTMS